MKKFLIFRLFHYIWFIDSENLSFILILSFVQIFYSQFRGNTVLDLYSYLFCKRKDLILIFISRNDYIYFEIVN